MGDDATVAHSGQVVVLNGPSSAGKTTLALAFRHARAAAGDCWLVLGLDDFNDVLPHQWVRAGDHRGPHADDGLVIDPSASVPVRVGELGRRLFAAYRRTVALWARHGFNVVVDDVCFDEEAARDWHEALAGLDVTWVAVRCAPEVLVAREAARGDRLPGLARALATDVHRWAPVDVELDTTDATVDELCARLASQLHGRLPG